MAARLRASPHLVVAERGGQAAVIHDVAQYRGRYSLVGEGLGVGVAEGVGVDGSPVEGDGLPSFLD